MAARVRLIDIGANLADPMFVGLYRGKQKHVVLNDFEHMLQRAFTSQVEKIIITGGSLSESKEALALARTHDRLHCTVGVRNVRRQGTSLRILPCETKTTHDADFPHQVVAVGEFGLDYDRLEFCDRATQQLYFEKQFELAQVSNLPLFLHNRNTGADFYDMISRHRDSFRDGVVHSFTGSAAEAKQLVDLDLFIGINGCSLKTQDNLDVVKSIPIDRIMLETDAPWCDVRPTHASFAHVRTVFQSNKPDKFQLGRGVKGRNEPNTIMYILMYAHV
ncbi:hypothetical protein DYB26_001233 [Aphanomyces astaci]|uniref:Uncharacterized protein n=2 Tax=Aphanomyces astaci TaxID=112090 RepID=A0A397AV87_APHAT|nr:hypothetical protein DYB36_001839 [Aphanomyces astaci]RHY83291.1 hypothetical protein DYB26_001233 [Aphanomyces astaci]